MTYTTKHTQELIDIPTPCSVCGTRGWILARNDTHGLRIERCDECAIMNDSQAWDIAESFLADLLMRFDEGTNLEKATAAPAMYVELKLTAYKIRALLYMLPVNCDVNERTSLEKWLKRVKAALAQAEGR